MSSDQATTDLPDGPFVDADVHLPTPSVDDLAPYLPDHWNEYIATAGFRGSMGVSSTYPAGAATSGRDRLGSSIDEGVGNLVASSMADVANARALTTVHYGVEGMGPPDFSIALARAVNDWQLHAILPRDDRLMGCIVVPPQYPALAAEEIDRVGGNERLVQVFLPARTSGGKPYGNRNYYPLFEAAVRNDVAVGLHFGGMSYSPSTPVGWPSYYMEEYVGMAHVMASQLASLVVEGTFARFPELRLAMVEGGWTWLPSFMWRLDKEWKGIRRETPWVKEAPSSYIRRQVRFTVQPIDAPQDGDEVMTTLEQVASDDVLMYASDFPHVHGTDPVRFVDRLSPELARKLLHDNAAGCFGLPEKMEAASR